MTTQTFRSVPTSCSRNGTFIRVLIVDTPGREHVRVDDVDVRLHRILVLIASTLESLDTQTCSLQRAAAVEGIALVSADGHHDAILNRIAAANQARR